MASGKVIHNPEKLSTISSAQAAGGQRLSPKRNAQPKRSASRARRMHPAAIAPRNCFTTRLSVAQPPSAVLVIGHPHARGRACHRF